MEEGYDVHAVYVDLGQPCEDRAGDSEEGQGLRGQVGPDRRCPGRAVPRLRLSGAAVAGEVRRRSICWARSIARPLISKVCLQVAREVGADAYAHGATGKGNDQCRFQLAAEALNPAIKIIAPWRIEKFRQRFPGRTEMIAFCNQKNIPVKASVSQALQQRRKLPAHQLRGGQARRPERQRRGDWSSSA